MTPARLTQSWSILQIASKGSLKGLMDMVADEIAANIKTADLVSKLTAAFGEEIAAKLPGASLARVSRRGAKRRRISADQTTLG